MASIRFYHIDHNYVGFEGDRDVIYELRSRYSFYASNYKWDKRYKLGYWDGKISMLNLKDNRMYAGLLQEVKQHLDVEKIEYIDDTDLSQGRDFTHEQILNFYKKIDGPFVPHDSQSQSFQHCISSGRNITLAPTSNGKSYIIHGLNSYYSLMKKRVLVVINRAQLVMQLQSNFEDEYNSKKIYTTSTIYDDNQDTDVLITTWQSIVDKPAKWFKQFQVLIADEVHTFKAKSLIKIVNNCGHIENRHGFTATLDNDSLTDAMTLEGMFGKPFQAITLQEQIEQGISARPIVYVVMIKYPVEERRDLIATIRREKNEAAAAGKKNAASLDFVVESNFLENHERRTNLITDIAKMQKGNTLIAFKAHEHGKSIFKNLQTKVNCPTFFANSTVSKEKRFQIQKMIETLEQSVATVSFGTFSTGINIPNLNNLIIGSQVKSQITVPQLVGRMIRLSKGKSTANVIDICDDLSHNNRKNIFFKHFEERMKYYVKNNFEIKIKTVTI